MGYGLGIDVGTTFSAAAIWRDERVEVVALGSHRVIVPTVMFADGEELLFGFSAVSSGNTKPVGVAREFKRRLGDSVPLVLSGSPYSADRLVALFTRWIVDAVAAQLAESPEQVVVTHPANWTQFQLHLLAQALREVGLGNAEFLSEPEAAAYDYSSSSNIAAGELVLVYDLGGGTFDVALLRRENNAFTHVGEAAGVERLGGIDFDEAVFQHVLSQLPAESIEQARADATGRMAMAHLRRACVETKEELSTAIAVEVPVVLPGYTTTVRLTRSDFEDMIRPMLGQTVDLVRRVMAGADIGPEDLSAILLIGGASRSPLVADLVGHTLDATVRIDAHPKLVVARGAARWAGRAMAPPDEGATTRRSIRRWWPAGVGMLTLGVVVAGGLWARPSNDDATTTPNDRGTATADVTQASSGVPAGPLTAASVAASTASSASGTPPSEDLPMTVSGVELIGQASIAPDFTFGATAVGGLSGIAFDAGTGTYYAMSDDPALPRYYELAIDVADGRLDDGEINVVGITTLLDQLGAPWPAGSLEADAVALSDDGTVLVADEGIVGDEANLVESRPPSLYQFGLDGTFRAAVPAPPWYRPTVDRSSGMQGEGGFSSLTLVPGQPPTVIVASELALQHDLAAAAGGSVGSRILVYDVAGGFPIAEHGYPLAQVPSATAPGALVSNRLVELLAIDEVGTFLALEISPSGALVTNNLLFESSLPLTGDFPPAAATPQPIAKRLVVDFGATGLPVGEFQGMALGPTLADGRRVLIVVLDNNLDPAVETQFLAFAIQLEPATA